jgi:hypothetical protein
MGGGGAKPSCSLFIETFFSFSPVVLIGKSIVAGSPTAYSAGIEGNLSAIIFPFWE